MPDRPHPKASPPRRNRQSSCGAELATPPTEPGRHAAQRLRVSQCRMSCAERWTAMGVGAPAQAAPLSDPDLPRALHLLGSSSLGQPRGRSTPLLGMTLRQRLVCGRRNCAWEVTAQRQKRESVPLSQRVPEKRRGATHRASLRKPTLSEGG